MTARLRDRPAGWLTRHFFRALLDFGVFTQAGADAFVRTLIGLAAALLSLGLLLVYMYVKKYASLAAAADGGPYAQALLADMTLAVGLPMWIVALLTVLVSHSLFPDETDFRVLVPLPIGRGLVFGAKLLALALFAGLFTLTTHLALTPFVARISAGRWASDGASRALLAYWIVSPLASAFALLAVAAVNGVIIVCLPRARVHGALGTMRSAMIGALVLALPLVMALPTHGARLAQRSPLLFLAPPAWFMGLDRVLLGHTDPYFVQLGETAAAALALVSILSLGTYAVLYRRFDRVMLHTLTVPRRGRFRLPASGGAARAAVRDFTAATFRRSALHQGVAIGLSACGVALAANSLVRSGVVQWLGGLEVPYRQVLEAVAWAPFPLVVVLGLAARSSLALPIEPKANWVFRLTERDAIRVDELRAAERIVTRFAVFVPVLLTLPLQWMAAGPYSLAASTITVVAGALWVEILLRDWQRIPFTCSYMPGKHAVAQLFVVGLLIFLLVSTIGGGLELVCLQGRVPAPLLVIVATLVAITLTMRRGRRARWSQLPLMFDDELPSDVQVFRLSDG